MSPPAPHLGEEILEEIFFHLRTPAALARASTACPLFRRIIAGRSFLRRYRKRHPPPLLGFVDKYGLHPAQAPHPSAPLARALADAADFTYSFVPNPCSGNRWRPRDVRDGRVLLDDGSWCAMFRNLAVCDPLSRRYTLLPPIPMDHIHEKAPSEIKPVLAPIGEEEEDDETSFKVICFADFQTELVAFVFSSLAPKWSIAASTSWASLGGRPHMLRFVPYLENCLSRFDYAHGCFYSPSPWTERLLVLDTHRMEFSTVNDVLVNDTQPGIVVGKEGALEMFSFADQDEHIPNGSFDIYHTTRQNNNGENWQLENINVIPLPTQQHGYFTIGADQGFLFLGAIAQDHLDVGEESHVSLSRPHWTSEYFSLEVQTSQLIKVCRRKKPADGETLYCYFGFPPSLSRPSI